jgi:hypothetical protein
MTCMSCGGSGFIVHYSPAISQVNPKVYKKQISPCHCDFGRVYLESLYMHDEATFERT